MVEPVGVVALVEVGAVAVAAAEPEVCVALPVGTTEGVEEAGPELAPLEAALEAGGRVSIDIHHGRNTRKRTATLLLLKLKRGLLVCGCAVGGETRSGLSLERS